MELKDKPNMTVAKSRQLRRSPQENIFALKQHFTLGGRIQTAKQMK